MSEYRRLLAFRAGKMAAERGKSRDTCNRERGTIFFDDWQDGFGEGERLLAAAIARAEPQP